MSRFTGWDSAAVARLEGKQLAEIPQRKKQKPNSDLNDKLSAALNVLKLKHVREYKFLTDRRFRLDFAFPEIKLAVEIEGGIFTGGRHTRAGGFIRDAKKYNLLTMNGWKLLRYTTADAKGEMFFALLVNLL